MRTESISKQRWGWILAQAEEAPGPEPTDLEGDGTVRNRLGA